MRTGSRRAAELRSFTAGISGPAGKRHHRAGISPSAVEAVAIEQGDDEQSDDSDSNQWTGHVPFRLVTGVSSCRVIISRPGAGCCGAMIRPDLEQAVRPFGTVVGPWHPGCVVLRSIAEFGLPQTDLTPSTQAQKISRFAECFEPHQPASGCYEP